MPAEDLAIPDADRQRGVALIEDTARTKAFFVMWRPRDLSDGMRVLKALKAHHEGIYQDKTRIEAPFQRAIQAIQEGLEEIGKLYDPSLDAVAAAIELVETAIRNAVGELRAGEQRAIQEAAMQGRRDEVARLAANVAVLPEGLIEAKLPITWELEDIDQVPEEYLRPKVVHAARVRDAINKGVREIPGLRIDQENAIGVRISTE